MKFDHNVYTELAILPKKKLDNVKQHYATVSKAYMGHITEITNQKKELEHQIELLKKDNELAKQKYENELLKKEIKLIKMQQKLDAN